MIKEGSIVIVCMHDDKSSHMLTVKGTQKLFKKQVDVTSMINEPFGSIFELVGNKLSKVDDNEVFDFDGATNDFEENDNEDEGEGNGELPHKGSNKGKEDPIGNSFKLERGDNRHINDTNTAQKTSMENILAMVDQGVEGKAIINKLIKNSETFAQKSDFGQEKWLKKKRKKYMKRLRVVECTPLTLVEVYHCKNKEKVHGLRADSLCQIISRASVYSGARVLVMDTSIGMVVGSIAYRMQGRGRILALYPGQQPHFESVHSLNMEDNVTTIIQPIPIVELAPAARYVRENGFKESTSMDPPQSYPRVYYEGAKDSSPEDVEKWKQSIAEKVPEDAVLGPRPESYRKSYRKEEHLVLSRSWLREGCTSLIIVTKYRPLPILIECIPLVAPSSPFVVYSEFKEVLVECYKYLFEKGYAINMTIGDMWMREFQTLPGRMHPQMFTSTSTGYILNGIIVHNYR